MGSFNIKYSDKQISIRIKDDLLTIEDYQPMSIASPKTQVDLVPNDQYTEKYIMSLTKYYNKYALQLGYDEM
jgi:hypothetical protein